jgi:hypothetical protein
MSISLIASRKAGDAFALSGGLLITFRANFSKV